MRDSAVPTPTTALDWSSWPVSWRRAPRAPRVTWSREPPGPAAPPEVHAPPGHEEHGCAHQQRDPDGAERGRAHPERAVGDGERRIRRHDAQLQGEGP